MIYLTGTNADGSVTYNTQYDTLITNFINSANLITANIDTTEVSSANFAWLFYNWHPRDFITKVNLINLPPATSLSSAFGSCNNLTDITISLGSQDVSSSITSYCSVDSICKGCRSLTDASANNIINYISNSLLQQYQNSYSSLFSNCKNLVNVKPIELTSSLKYASGMFENCNNLITANLWGNTENVITADSLFYNCNNLVVDNTNIINLFASSIYLNNTSRMFTNVKSLTQPLNLAICNNIKNTSEMYRGTSISDFPYYNYSSVKDMYAMTARTQISNVENLELIDKVRLDSLFASCYNLKTVSDLYFVANHASDIFSYANNLQSATNIYIEGAESVDRIFQNCSSLNNLINVTLVGQNFYGVFNGCHNLKNIINITLKAPQFTSLYETFSSCNNLKNTNNIIFSSDIILNAARCFNFCVNLTDAPNLDLTQCTNLDSMYYHCSSLVNVNKFSTKSIIQMKSMFYNCPNLSVASIENIGASAPYKNQVNDATFVNAEYYGMYVGLSSEQYNIMLKNSDLRAQLKMKGWSIYNTSEPRVRVTEVASMENNAPKKYKIGMNAEYITILKNSLTFLNNDITGQDIESSFSDYLNLKAQEIVPYCWEVSYDFGNIENRITEKIYDDISSNGQYLRDYLNTINAPVYNLSIIQSQAPNFKDASKLLEKGV